MIRAAGLTLAAVLCLAAAAPESRLEEYFRLRKEAGAAAQGGDLAKAETLLERALEIYPTAPGSFIRLARVEAAAGKPEEAVAHLATYAELGLTYDVAGDKTLAAVAGRPDFTPVEARLAANGRPVGNPAVLATLPRGGPIYEGLARHGDGWLVSSVTERTIYRIDARGAVSTFLVAAPSTGGIFGLAVNGDTVWAAEASGPEIPGSEGPARTALLKIDARTGTILERYPVPDDGKPHQLGDVAVDLDGAVYASDSTGSAIWRLTPERRLMEPLLQSNELGSPQGMVVCDAGALLIADYPSGLHRLDLTSGKLEAVGGVKVALAGTDGLFRVWPGSTARHARPAPLEVVVTQNGVAPARVVMLTLSPDCREIRSARVLAANHPALDDLTLGADAGGAAAVIGRAGWAGYGPGGKPVAGATPQPAQILRIPYAAD